jgi:DNA-binding beta-propeller fold protein YncE
MSPKRSLLLLPLILAVALVSSGCDVLFGSKFDPTTDEIFDAGRIDPRLVEDVGYVPLTPFFELGMNGQFQSPRDIYIGYDEFIYVVDDDGLHVLDLAGRPQYLFDMAGGQPLRGTSVIQDRRFHVYVTARRDTTIGGMNWNLPVIYRIEGLTTAGGTGGGPRIADIIWHPFDDDSRKFNRPNPIPTDTEVEFTGVAVLHDNRVYVSRRGPTNDPRSVLLPHNAVMVFNQDGLHTRTLLALSATNPSLRSAIYPGTILSYIQPPQRRVMSANDDFIIAQNPRPGENELQYSVLSIQVVETFDGLEYRPDTQKLSMAQFADTTQGDGFLYEEYKFSRPSGMAFAADGTNYLFVVDAGSDSLYVFNARGVEGVAPPPGARSIKPVRVSFGGFGEGPMQFRNPEGVAYFRRIVYVADTGNNRIARYRLNTDFE